LSTRNRTLEESLRLQIKEDAKRYSEDGQHPSHCLMHPDTWLAVVRESTLPQKEKRAAEKARPYRMGYHYRLHPTQHYNAGHNSVMCYPCDDIEEWTALLCDRATASLYIDELLNTEED
jgi:hypothetical protein